MKKYVLLCLMSALSFNALGNDYENYKLNISGEVEAVIKSQDNITTPFDYVDWGWAVRGGADERESQFARVQGTLNFSSGTLGMSEYFAVMSLYMDPQASNDNVELRKGQLGEPTWTQFERNKVELTNAFVMWRPWAVKDEEGNLIGRPFGITVGNQSIPATANALSTNFFRGDIDGDFIAYTTTALLNKPGVHVDFHTGKIGLGYAYLRGSSDLINNSSGFDNGVSETHVIYANAKQSGFHFNVAYQNSKGNRKVVDSRGDVKDFFGGNNENISVNTDKDAYSGNVLNLSLAYELALGENSTLKPFIAYQKTNTEVAPDIIVETANKYYNTGFNIQKVEAEFTTVGASYETTLFGRRVRIAGEFSKCDTPKSQGLDLVYDGQVDYAVQQSFDDIRNGAKAGIISQLGGTDYDSVKNTTYAGFGGLTGSQIINMMLPATEYNMEAGNFQGIAGNGKTTYTLAGLDSMGQLEATIEMSSNVDLTFFYKMAKGKNVNNKVSDSQIEQLKQGFIGSGITTDNTIAEAMAKGLAGEIEKAIKDGTKWSDYNSFGMSVVYRF